MNRLFMRSFLTALLCLGSAFIFAEEEVPFPEVIRVEDQEENDVDIMPFTESIVGNHKDSDYLQRIHNNGYYHLVATSDSGGKVQLHDASKWAVERSGQDKVLKWVQSDDIFIKPTAACCFSHYAYVLYNRTTNQAVGVNLIQPPLPMGAYTFRIVNIEPHQHLVLLSDNTIWKVENSYAFSQWQIGQRVLVGVNNKWRTALFPHILINVDISSEPYSQASFYGYPAG